MLHVILFILIWLTAQVLAKCAVHKHHSNNSHSNHNLNNNNNQLQTNSHSHNEELNDQSANQQSRDHSVSREYKAEENIKSPDKKTVEMSKPKETKEIKPMQQNSVEVVAKSRIPSPKTVQKSTLKKSLIGSKTASKREIQSATLIKPSPTIQKKKSQVSHYIGDQAAKKKSESCLTDKTQKTYNTSEFNDDDDDTIFDAPSIKRGTPRKKKKKEETVSVANSSQEPQ